MPRIVIIMRLRRKMFLFSDIVVFRVSILMVRRDEEVKKEGMENGEM